MLEDEHVPAREKIVSLFEFHTDVIVKDNRKVLYGHKINVISGEKGFIICCRVEQGNTADSEAFMPMLEKCEAQLNTVPKEVCADGGYASLYNAYEAKDLGVENIGFSKTCGLDLEDLLDDTSMHEPLKHFRAGIESNISELKRRYRLTRCTWKHFAGFCRYVFASICSYNLFRVAKLLL